MERPSSACPGSAPSRARHRLADERGDVVLTWLVKLALVFGLASLALFDAISIGVTTANVADQGAYAARDASETWSATKDLQKTYAEASSAATERNPLNTIDPASFRVDPDGRVHLRISRTATTLVLFRIGPIKSWAVVEREASGRSVG